MTGYAITASGQRWQLPPLMGWELTFTTGVPCDSFWLRCPWDGANGSDPKAWSGFLAEEQGRVVFTGVIDECEEMLSPSGRRMELSGRGMAARLLDNEALPQDYGRATLADILRDHVTPYGITLAKPVALPAVREFSVASGSSEWTVLHDFARYYGGASPRFDQRGQLVLSGWEESERLAIGDETPVTELTCRDKRYGVLSQVWVRDRFRDTVEKVENKTFLAQGGQARRVFTMPGRSDWQSMRYSGQFQLDQSEAERLNIEVEIPILFFAKPGDLVELNRSNWERNGIFRVAEAQVSLDETGGRTRLTLGNPDFVV